MKRLVRLEDPFDEFVSFDMLRGRFLSPFKPRAPTPPKSKEPSPKHAPRHIQYRTSSVDSGGVFVLRVPFDSVSYVNQQTALGMRKKRVRKFYLHRRRNSGSLEKCY